jgi:lipopolysaccharide assembly outer membrane protein LptD (OstA)
MKLKLTVALTAGLLGGALLSPHALKPVHAQSPAIAEPKLYVTDTFTSHGQPVILAANSIDRDSSVIRLRGNVEIKLSVKSYDADFMVLRADEAEYHRQGDEIIPQGNVRVTFERKRK